MINRDQLRQMYLVNRAIIDRGDKAPDYQNATTRREYKPFKKYEPYDFFAMYMYTAGCLVTSMLWLYMYEAGIASITEEDYNRLMYELANNKLAWKTYIKTPNCAFGLFNKCIAEDQKDLPVLWHTNDSPDLIRPEALHTIQEYFFINNLANKKYKCAFGDNKDKLYIVNVNGHFVVIDRKSRLIFDPAGNSLTKKNYFPNGICKLKIDWSKAMCLKEV